MSSAALPTYRHGDSNAQVSWARSFQSDVARAATTIAANGSTTPAYLHQLLTSARATALTLGRPGRGHRTKEALSDAAAIWAEVSRLVDSKTTDEHHEEQP